MSDTPTSSGKGREGGRREGSRSRKETGERGSVKGGSCVERVEGKVG
jgi:hypothetical protein